ncbi:hypothetical protein TIFTF001_034219 [Ficus carica]|uniref:Uncharacterized protein n=1 Tax=Ficus carica TaxID=3494 RepID=A0AA88J8K0_FICCA|nr:hypothetical protein TIFTF001_034219 [Ficus carica]
MDKNICKNFLILVVYLSFFKNNGHHIMAAPTDGFTPVNLVRPNNFQLLKPYDQPAQNRYSGTTLSPSYYEKFSVYSTDQPFMQGSPTKPRTEMGILVLIYFFSFRPHMNNLLD